MSGLETIMWTLIGSVIGAALSVGLALFVERRRLLLRYKPLKSYAGDYLASEIRDGVAIRELFWLRLDIDVNTPGVMKITGMSRVKENPELSGELFFENPLFRANGSYVHNGNPNMFGYFDVRVLSGVEPSFHVHQRFIRSGLSITRNEVWNKYSGPRWEKQEHISVDSSSIQEEDTVEA